MAPGLILIHKGNMANYVWINIILSSESVDKFINLLKVNLGTGTGVGANVLAGVGLR